MKRIDDKRKRRDDRRKWGDDDKRRERRDGRKVVENVRWSFVWHIISLETFHHLKINKQPFLFGVWLTSRAAQELLPPDSWSLGGWWIRIECHPSTAKFMSRQAKVNIDLSHIIIIIIVIKIVFYRWQWRTMKWVNVPPWRWLIL